MTEEQATTRRPLVVPLFLIAVAFVVLSPLYWRHVELRRINEAESDHSERVVLYHVVYPVYQYAFGRLAAGELPLWNPHQHNGMPLHADPRVGLFQPLHLVHVFLPTHQAMAVHAFLCLSLMGFGAALFIRSLGVASVPAFFGGLVFAFSGASAGAMSHPPTAAALAWSPLAFWALHEHLRTWRWEFAALGSLFGALMLLSGSLIISVAMLCLFAPYAIAGMLWPLETEPPRLLRRLRSPLIMLALALLMAAVQWVPTVLWMRELDAPGELAWSLPLTMRPSGTFGDLGLQTLMARRGVTPRIGYVGIGTLLMLPPVLTHWIRRRHAAYFLLAAAVFVTLHVLGAGGRTHALPHSAFAYAYPAVFAVAVLAALGVDRLLVEPQGHRTPALLPPALLVLFVAAALFYVSTAQVRGYVLAFLVVLVPLFFLRHRALLFLGGVALSALVFIDLSVASANIYGHPFVDAPGSYETRAELLEAVAQQAGDDRVLVASAPFDVSLATNAAMLHGFDAVGGVAFPLTTGQRVWWDRLTDDILRVDGSSIAPDAAAPRLLNYMAARVVVADRLSPLYDGQWANSGPRLSLATRTGDVRIYTNADALPRAYWTPRWRSGFGAEAAADILAGAEFDPDRECLLDRPPDLPDPALDGAILTRKDADCAIEWISPEEVIVRVTAPADGITVLLDTWAPGWTATRNGESVLILRANGLFRGVATPAGTHTIVFRYQPRGIIAGSILTGLGLVLALFASMGFRIHRRRARAR